MSTESSNRPGVRECVCTRARIAQQSWLEAEQQTLPPDLYVVAKLLHVCNGGIANMLTEAYIKRPKP